MAAGLRLSSGPCLWLLNDLLQIIPPLQAFGVWSSMAFGFQRYSEPKVMSCCQSWFEEKPELTLTSKARFGGEKETSTMTGLEFLRDLLGACTQRTERSGCCLYRQISYQYQGGLMI